MASTSAGLFRMRRSVSAASMGTSSNSRDGGRERHPGAVAELVRLEAQTRDPALGQEPREQDLGRHVGLHELPVGRLGRSLLHVSVVGQDAVRAGRDQKRPRVARGGLVASADDEAGQVPTHGRGTDDDAVEAFCGEDGSQGCQAYGTLGGERIRPMAHAGHSAFIWATLASCSASVTANRCEPSRTPFGHAATKKK